MAAKEKPRLSEARIAHAHIAHAHAQNAASMHCAGKNCIMQTLLQLAVVACALSLASSTHDFSNYPFKTTLNTEEDGGLYELYWNFDNDAERIDFAVRVQTTGWVGFGLSPNGQMPNSDVVIGWVTDDGDTVFHVS